MSDDDQKKDLTSIIDLPQADPVKTDDGSPTFDSLPPIEKIDDFESLDQIGMMDHPVQTEQPPMEGAEAAPANEVPAFDPNAFQPMVPDAPPAETTQPLEQSATSIEQFAPVEQNTEAVNSDPPMDLGQSAVIETATALDAPPTAITHTEFKPIEPPPPVIPPPTIDDIKEYSEQSQESSHDYTRSFPFRLLLSGDFDPYARDKLLLFITDNPIGITSADLDFQIKAGRVLIPQISEYAGIRLIQELRETGLQFKLMPAETDADEVAPEAPAQRYQWSASAEATPPIPEIAILPSESINTSIHEVIDSLQTVQFIRAEVIEFEKSEMFQNLLDRMLASLKAKAARRGGVALTHVKHTITPLAVASQYEVQVTASLVKSINA